METSAFVTRTLRGPRAGRLLSACGVDPRRYWLLVDLFARLSERGEMLDQMGLNGYALKSASLLYFAFSALISIAFLIVRPAVTIFFTAYMSLTAFLLFTILLSEAGNSLLNPNEAMILAHQPVNGATYTSAKLSHLLRIVFYLVPGINTIPAVAGLAMKGATWTYPFRHLAAAFGVGITSALVCCALLGLMLRLIPARRLKAIGQFAGAVPFLLMSTGGQFGRLFRRIRIPAQIFGLIPAAAVRWSLAVLALMGIVFGLRALRADYLIRVASMTRGGAAAGSRVRRSWLAAIVRRFFGGQQAVAGFMFTSRMMLRDWQFRRQLLPLLIFPLVALGTAVRTGLTVDPFSGKFAPLHLLPHMLAFLSVSVCTMLPYGNDYKGKWIFSSVPARAMDGFASGVFATLWLFIVLIPHLVIYPLLIFWWGPLHALLFIFWSFAAASIYLALELLMIDGIPFTRQVDPSRQSVGIMMLLGGGVVVSIAVALQHYVIFRSPWIVVVTAAILAAAAYFVTRSSLNNLAESMRFRMAQDSSSAGTLYREIAA